MTAPSYTICTQELSQPINQDRTKFHPPNPIHLCKALLGVETSAIHAPHPSACCLHCHPSLPTPPLVPMLCVDDDEGVVG